MNKAATRCLTASADFDIRLWNAIAGSELGVFPGGHVLKAVTYTHDETRFVAGGYSKKLMVFDPDTPGAPVLSIEHPTVRQAGLSRTSPVITTAPLPARATALVSRARGIALRHAYEGTALVRSRAGSLFSRPATSRVPFIRPLRRGS